MEPEYVTVYEGDSIKEAITDHEDRITQNEEFRLMVKGALMVLSAILGTGFGITFIAFVLGAI